MIRSRAQHYIAKYTIVANTCDQSLVYPLTYFWHLTWTVRTSNQFNCDYTANYENTTFEPKKYCFVLRWRPFICLGLLECGHRVSRWTKRLPSNSFKHKITILWYTNHTALANVAEASVSDDTGSGSLNNERPKRLDCSLHRVGSIYGLWAIVIWSYWPIYWCTSFTRQPNCLCMRVNVTPTTSM